MYTISVNTILTYLHIYLFTYLLIHLLIYLLTYILKTNKQPVEQNVSWGKELLHLVTCHLHLLIGCNLTTKP